MGAVLIISVRMGSNSAHTGNPKMIFLNSVRPMPDISKDLVRAVRCFHSNISSCKQNVPSYIRTEI